MGRHRIGVISLVVFHDRLDPLFAVLTRAAHAGDPTMSVRTGTPPGGLEARP
jgi:hypothetical protein